MFNMLSWLVHCLFQKTFMQMALVFFLFGAVRVYKLFFGLYVHVFNVTIAGQDKDLGYICRRTEYK